MGSFGDALRELRREHGWRQQDLADELGGGIARSTLANVESGREPPTARLWQLLTTQLPEQADAMVSLYEQARANIAQGQPDGPRNGARPKTQTPSTRTGTSGADQSSGRPPDEPDLWTLGGPFILEHITYVYVFRESRSPEEILEVRRVRATADGARRFGFKLETTESGAFDVESEALWGGHLVTDSRRVGNRTVYLRRIEFGRTLRSGDVHEFALRTWVERDPDPSTTIVFSLTRPALAVTVQMNFYGSVRPARIWRGGPVADEILMPREPTRTSLLPISRGGSVITTFTEPDLGSIYGVSWAWPDQHPKAKPPRAVPAAPL